MIADRTTSSPTSTVEAPETMRSRLLRSSLLLLVATAALTSLGVGNARAAEERTFDRTLNVNDSPTLDVATGSGNIHLHAGSNNQLHVVGHIHSNRGWMNLGGGDVDARMKQIASNPPVRQNGNEITIGERNQSDLFRNISIDYDITLPSAVVIAASSGSGDVLIEDVGVRLKADTGSGSVRVRGVHGAAELETGSGDIELSQAAPGDVKVQTGSGSIRLNDIAGRLKAETGSGDIEIRGNPATDWKLNTGSGNIHLSLGAAKFSVNASTGSGTIHIDQPSVMQADSDKHDVHASVNGGGPVINADTGSGDIRVN